jgi:hypothetical protein
MYLQPTGNGDSPLDFYAMYKKETMEYDAEQMQKYNEGLNSDTTLIRASFRVPFITTWR